MSLRWYSVVIDSPSPRTLAAWWATTLDWQVVYEADDEVVIIPSWVTPEKMAATPWEETGPGLVFVLVSDPKTTKNRLHLDLAPRTGDDRDAMIAGLVERGATLVDVGQGDVSWTVLADPEGNEFCVLSARDR